MSNNTARLAREWAEEYQNDWPKFTPGTHAAELVEKAKAAAEHILATTTEPTMADVEWNDEKHAFGGAVINFNIGPTEVVMLSEGGCDDLINFALSDGRVGTLSKSRFTPNGKRYELREIAATVSSNDNVGPDQPEHPATLNTMVDYDSAPEGTIVLDGYEDPWVKRENLWCIRNLKATSEDMARWNDLEVARWGWGK